MVRPSTRQPGAAQPPDLPCDALRLDLEPAADGREDSPLELELGPTGLVARDEGEAIVAEVDDLPRRVAVMDPRVRRQAESGGRETAGEVVSLALPRVLWIARSGVHGPGRGPRSR